MTDISNIKFPRARITVFFVSISVAAVLSGALANLALAENNSLIYVTNQFSRQGGLTDILLSLADQSSKIAFQLLLIYLAVYTMFSAAIAYSVMLYRGFSLGWCLAALASSKYSVAIIIYPVFYFAVNVIVADICAEAVFFSSKLKNSSITSVRAIPSYSVKKFSHKYFSVSALAMLLSELPQIISAFIR